MKRPLMKLAVALCCAVLVAPAVARDHRDGGREYRAGRHEHRDFRPDHRGHRGGPPGHQWRNGPRHGPPPAVRYSRPPAVRYGPPPAVRYGPPPAVHYVPARPPRWSRGDRLPPRYRQPVYVVHDWRARNFRAPPRGYHWVNVGADYFLVGVATGLILQAVIGR